MKMILFFSSVIAILLILLILTIVHYKRQISLFGKELGNTLDTMISWADVPWEDLQPCPDLKDAADDGKEKSGIFPDLFSDTLSGKINSKLKRLFEILHQKNEKSRQEKEKLNTLISDISHQTKTPIANLKMYQQILSEREMGEEKRREFLGRSLAQTEKLEFLITALVKMSRLENGIISFSHEKIQAALIAADSLAQIMPFAERKSIAVKVDCPEELFVRCDRKWTSEALFNVLDNAVKYTPENGSISVSVCENEFYAMIRVKDSGIGIPEAEQAKVFCRFYRSEAVKEVEGLGLGLFLTRQILSAQGGFIVVKSEQNNGAEFIINIPRG